MKKFLSWLVIIILCFLLVGLTVVLYYKDKCQNDNNNEIKNGTEGLAFYPINDTECAVAVGDAIFLNEIVIPSKYKNFTVTAIIGKEEKINGGFANCANIISITIPNSVTKIGDNAFSDCSSLTNIVIPDSVTSIGNEAFVNCSNLTNIVIGDNVTSIGYHAFANCDSLTSILIPINVTSIGNHAFLINNKVTIYCEAVSKPEGWDDNWNTYNNPVVWGYDADRDIIVEENGITYYVKDDNASVVGCKANVNNVVIPATITNNGSTYKVTDVYDYVFYACSTLTNVVVGGNVTSIGDSAFNACINLTSIVIGDSVASIGRRAFWGCAKLTSIVIGDNVTKIGNYAFNSCSNLIIYGEAESEPENWEHSWNNFDRPVYWAGQWDYDESGKIITRVTVYFKNTANWSNVYAYAWTDTEGGKLGSYPGSLMTEVEGKDDWYSIEVVGAQKIFFTDGADYQTVDFIIYGERLYFVFGASYGTSSFDEEPVISSELDITN